MNTKSRVQVSLHKLREYVEGKEFKGWDPYDGLNSVVFQKTFLRRSSLARLAWIQVFKRSPVNFRRMLLVREGYNSKGLALFLSGYLKMYRDDPQENYLTTIHSLVDKIKSMISPGYAGACWGYNFDWQARAFYQPAGTPTVVATTYVVSALLDYYDITRDDSILKICRSSCEFVLKDLNRTADVNGNFCFSYSPLDRTQVFNASLLGSRLLSRVYAHTREEFLKDAAAKSVAYCCSFQQPSGAWAYGTLPFHSWIDNFHTGFNLECISEYQRCCGDDRFADNLSKGLAFYVDNFFTAAGESKYYHDKLYPVDIHAPAQLVITLGTLGLLEKKRELVDRVIEWTLTHMTHRKGYFYYQLKPGWSSKIPYMRWAQAWMFNAMSYYVNHFNDTKKESSF